jgi:hypothetical protein
MYLDVYIHIHTRAARRSWSLGLGDTQSEAEVLLPPVVTAWLVIIVKEAPLMMTMMMMMTPSFHPRGMRYHRKRTDIRIQPYTKAVCGLGLFLYMCDGMTDVSPPCECVRVCGSRFTTYTPGVNF